jgi:hypothetical protein
MIELSTPRKARTLDFNAEMERLYRISEDRQRAVFRFTLEGELDELGSILDVGGEEGLSAKPHAGSGSEPIESSEDGQS